MKLDQTDGCVDKLCDKHMYWDQDLWFVGSNNLCQTSYPRQMASPGLSADWSSSWRAKHTRLSSYQRRTLQSHKLSIWQSKWAHSGQMWEMRFWMPHFWVPAIWPIHCTGLAAWLLLTARSEGMVRILLAHTSLYWQLPKVEVNILYPVLCMAHFESKLLFVYVANLGHHEARHIVSQDRMSHGNFCKKRFQTLWA